MPHIRLTETVYIAAERVEMVRLIQGNGKQGVELWHRRTDVPPSYFWGDEANEAWNNWRRYVHDAEEDRRSTEGNRK